MEVARKPAIKVIWNNKNVTEDISKYLSSVTYTDNEEGMSDDATFNFDNSTQIWSEDFYPTEGDTIELFMGYTNELINCGLFQVDEVTLSGSPDMIEIKAIAAGITKALRTRNNKAFEKLTLKQIANYFCKKHGLTLVDSTSMLSQINLDRKTQENKTDLAFLSDLAKEYGFLFSIRGNKLIFYSYYDLDNAKAVKDISKEELSTYSVTEKTYDTYASAKIKVHDPKTNKVVTKESESDSWFASVKVDKHVIQGKASNVVQAEAKVKAGLWSKNKFKQSGRITMPGDPSLISGINFNLTGLGNGSGKYHIVTSSHTLSGDGVYSTDLEIRKTGTIPKPKRVPKTTTKKESTKEFAFESLGENFED